MRRGTTSNNNQTPQQQPRGTVPPPSSNNVVGGTMNNNKNTIQPAQQGRNPQQQNTTNMSSMSHGDLLDFFLSDSTSSTPTLNNVNVNNNNNMNINSINVNNNMMMNKQNSNNNINFPNNNNINNNITSSGNLKLNNNNSSNNLLIPSSSSNSLGNNSTSSTPTLGSAFNPRARSISNSGSNNQLANNVNIGATITSSTTIPPTNTVQTMKTFDDSFDASWDDTNFEQVIQVIPPKTTSNISNATNTQILTRPPSGNNVSNLATKSVTNTTTTVPPVIPPVQQNKTQPSFPPSNTTVPPVVNIVANSTPSNVETPIINIMGNQSTTSAPPLQNKHLQPSGYVNPYSTPTKTPGKEDLFALHSAPEIEPPVLPSVNKTAQYTQPLTNSKSLENIVEKTTTVPETKKVIPPPIKLTQNNSASSLVLEKSPPLTIKAEPFVNPNLKNLKPGLCKHKCQIPNCVCYCAFDHSSQEYKDFIEAENGGLDFHMCSNSHPCQQFCSHRGFCEIKAEAKYNDVGLKHNCFKMLEPFKFSHSGKCLCYNDEDSKTAPRKHYCTKKCPACLSICRKEYGHDKNSFWVAKRSVDPKMKNINFETLSVKEKEDLLLHDTEHTFMINTVFVTDSKLLKNNAIEIPYIHQNQERLLRFFPGQNGAKFTCESYCRVLGRGHTYLTVCSHKHGKKLDSLNSSSSDLKATMETSEKQRSQSLLPKSTSQSEMSSLTPKNSEWSTANRIQFTTFTPTFNTKPATENVPRSRSVGSSLSDMAQPPELPSLVIESSTPSESQPSSTTPSISSSNNTSSTISSMTSTSSSSTGMISSGIGGVPRRSPSNTNIAGNNLESGTIISSGIGGVPKRSPSSTSVTDTPTGLIHGGGVPKSSSSNSMSDAKNKSTSPSTHNTNPSIVGSIGSLTVGGGSQIIVSPRGVPVSPRYGREDSMIITENFDDTASETEEDCPYNGELSLMATGRKHSTMKCQPMDELKHEKFWSLCGFVDPCKKACMSNEEMRQFNLCRVQKLETNSNSNTPLEYCRRHVSHQVLDCSALDYLEEVSLIAERFPAKETGCIFSPSGHLFKATPNTGIHHYIFVDVSRNMSSQDMIPSLPVFKPAGKSLKQSEKGEDYSQFSAFDNRLGAAIELVLRYLHILFKLRPSDKMTVGIFTKKTVEIIIDNEDLEYYYSVIDLITNKIKKPDNDGGYEEVFTLLVDLLAKHDPKQSKDPINRNMRPKIYLITANQLESKFSTPNFGKTASSSTGTPVWHSLGKLESLSLQRKKKKEQTKLDDIVEWYESNGINANSSAGSASEPEPYISIIKMGSEGNESTLNQILLKCKGLSTIVDSTFVSVNVNNKLTEEEKEAIKKKSGKEPALMQRLVICHMLQDLLLTHLEHNKMRLNENMRISGASSASSGKCGLLIKSVIDQMQHVDSESDSDYDSDDELANAGFGSFMIGKGHKGSPVDILEDLETVISNESNNIDSIKTLDSGSESKTSAEKQADDKQLENEKDILERENLAKEILDTERAYVTSMAKIIELYYYPLLKYLPNLISDDDKSKIFGGLLGIYKLHKILVTDLEERVNEWHKDQKIADIFIKLHQTFKLYTTFSTKYEMAIETYSKHKDNPRFRNYLYIRRKDPFSKGEQLQGFLIKPIQRIPRYILLLKGLLKHTKNPEHPDFNNLVNAISITEEVATFLNNKIRERQYFYRMKSVADRLSGLTDLIQPQRRYICEFDNLRATYDTHYNEECVVFLFNDLFIHAVRESENTQEEDGKLSRVRRKLSVKANSQPNIISTTASVPTPSVSSSTSELGGGSASGVAAMKIATAEGANGIGKSDNVDVMGIMEEKKKDRYEARFVLSLGDLTVHPMDFGSNNGTKFQISAIARKFTVEYDVTNRPNEKIKIITRLNDAITDFVKRKQSFQTIGQQNSTSPQH